ncbi:hypothetical protein M885DRAFT_208789 [Pelagophyceae sp. CCMP2097]|nr:hypothetical protein M885DRAFT_208789 [Pelagophyceae sp. CCMP2097]
MKWPPGPASPWKTRTATRRNCERTWAVPRDVPLECQRRCRSGTCDPKSPATAMKRAESRSAAQIAPAPSVLPDSTHLSLTFQSAVSQRPSSRRRSTRTTSPSQRPSSSTSTPGSWAAAATIRGPRASTTPFSSHRRRAERRCLSSLNSARFELGACP